MKIVHIMWIQQMALYKVYYYQKEKNYNKVLPLICYLMLPFKGQEHKK